MVSKLKAGRVDAVISDSTVLVPIAYADKACHVTPLEDNLGKFDIGFAFRRGFSQDHPGFVGAVSEQLVVLSEQGILAVRSTSVAKFNMSAAGRESCKLYDKHADDWLALQLRQPRQAVARCCAAARGLSVGQCNDAL